MSNSRINFVFLYLAYLKQVAHKKQMGIPALQLQYAQITYLVEGRREMSNFLEDLQAIYAFTNLGKTNSSAFIFSSMATNTGP